MVESYCDEIFYIFIVLILIIIISVAIYLGNKNNLSDVKPEDKPPKNPHNTKITKIIKKKTNKQITNKGLSDCQTCYYKLPHSDNEKVKVISHRCCYEKYINIMKARNTNNIFYDPSIKLFHNTENNKNSYVNSSDLMKVLSCGMLTSRCGKISCTMYCYHSTTVKMDYKYVIENFNYNIPEGLLLVTVITDDHKIDIYPARMIHCDIMGTILTLTKGDGKVLINNGSTKSAILYFTFCVHPETDSTTVSSHVKDNIDCYSESEDEEEEYIVDEYIDFTNDFNNVIVPCRT